MSARFAVRQLAGPAVTAVRDVYQTSNPDLLRIAALVDIAGSAATLARTIVRLHHVDPALLYLMVADRVDVGAVLGRGQWLPTMTRHVPAAPVGPVVVSLAARRRADGRQLPLFEDSPLLAGGAR